MEQAEKQKLNPILRNYVQSQVEYDYGQRVTYTDSIWKAYNF